MMKFEERKTMEVLDLITESMKEAQDQTGEQPTLYAETIADELAYRENTTALNSSNECTLNFRVKA